MEKTEIQYSESNSSGSMPARLVVEPTTFCNLSCTMCVKQATGNGIEEGAITMQVFNRLDAVFEGLDALVFSGIGEPLLHPELEQFIRAAARKMTDNSWIGIQTNGLLLNEERAMSLADAGLKVVCISMDAASSEAFSRIRAGGSIGEIEQAANVLNSVPAQNRPNGFRWGVQFVLMHQNSDHLYEVARWAVKNGASFLIVSNVVPYDQATEKECAYSPNTRPSLEFYQQWKEKAQALDLNLDDYLKQRWKYHWKPHKTEKEKALSDMGRQMMKEAAQQRIPLHFLNLIDEDKDDLERIRETFAGVRQICDDAGMELTLPELSPRLERKCSFIEDGSAFVSWKGEVFPCYYLWHSYTFYQNGRRVRVDAKSFGDIYSGSIESVWNSAEYAAFRRKVLQYDYPFCENCSLGPCNLFTEKAFEYDCYANDIPCGCCPWCGGLLNCLQ